MTSVSDNSLTDVDDSFYDVYSTQNVTSTYNNLLEKIKSGEDPSKKKVSDENEDENDDIDSQDDSSVPLTSPERVTDDDEEDVDDAEENSVASYTATELSSDDRSTLANCSQDDVSSDDEENGGRWANKRKRIDRKSTEIIELSDGEADGGEGNSASTSIDDEMNYEVTVKIVWKSVLVKTFRLRRFQKFTQIFKHFMDEEKVPLEQILLKVNNTKITASDTPDSLNLKVCDFIEGGILSDSASIIDRPVPVEPQAEDRDCLTIKIQDASTNCYKFSVNKDEPLKVVMMKYAEQVEVPFRKFRFYFDGEVLNPLETPNSLSMEAEEVIDVKIKKGKRR